MSEKSRTWDILSAYNEISEATADAVAVCPNCAADASDISFDRSICACGSMHYFCNQCGVAYDCPLDAA